MIPDEKQIRELKKDIVFDAHIGGESFTFRSAWGLFSPREIDEGSRLLLDFVETRPDDAILDIGCGYGAIGIPLARRAAGGNVHMVDKDFTALEYATKNARANRAENCTIYLSDGFNQVPRGARFDLVVSNLPAKVGKELFWIWLSDSRRFLKPGGRICVVTITGLREFIKRNFNDFFGNYEKLKQGRAYTVAQAVMK